MDIGMVKEAVAAIGNVLELAVKVLEKRPNAMPKLLKVLKAGTVVFPYAGIILSMVESFLPDQNHEEIMEAFKDLHRSIKEVREDIKELQTEIKWEITTVSYQECVSRIELAMEYAYEIGNSGNDHEKRRRYQKRLLEMNQTQELTLALRMLLDGITGEKDFFKNQILEQFYEKSKGDRPQLTLLSARLLQLVIGGTMSLMTWEALENGPDGPRDLQVKYGKRLKDVVLAIESLRDRCVREAEGNVHRDLDNIVKHNSSESLEDITETMFKFLTQKYDWLHFRCLVDRDRNDRETIPFTTNRSHIEVRHGGVHAVAHYFKKGCTTSDEYKEEIERKIHELCREEQPRWRLALMNDIRLTAGIWGLFFLPLLLILPFPFLVRLRVACKVRVLLEKSNIKWWTLVSLDCFPLLGNMGLVPPHVAVGGLPLHTGIEFKNGPDDKLIAAGNSERKYIIWLL